MLEQYITNQNWWTAVKVEGIKKTIKNGVEIYRPTNLDKMDYPLNYYAFILRFFF